MRVHAELWSPTGKLIGSQDYVGDRDWVREQIEAQKGLVFLRPCGGRE